MGRCLDDVTIWVKSHKDDITCINFLSQVNFLTVITPHFGTLIYNSRLKCPTFFKNLAAQPQNYFKNTSSVPNYDLFRPKGSIFEVRYWPAPNRLNRMSHLSFCGSWNPSNFHWIWGVGLPVALHFNETKGPGMKCYINKNFLLVPGKTVFALFWFH